jgi:hypothetical protein
MISPLIDRDAKPKSNHPIRVLDPAYSDDGYGRKQSRPAKR